MPTKNHGRMAQDMKRELIAIIGEMKDPRITGGLLTVTRLDVTPDLDQAKVYISVMGREGGPAPVVKALNKASGHVRTEISRRMHIRKAPRFVFVGRCLRRPHQQVAGRTGGRGGRRRGVSVLRSCNIFWKRGTL